MKKILPNQTLVFFIKDDKTVKEWVIVWTQHTTIESTQIQDEQLKYFVEFEITPNDFDISEDQLLESPITPQLQVNIVDDSFVFETKDGADTKLKEIEEIVAKNLKTSKINAINQYIETIIVMVDNELNDDYINSLRELIIDDEDRLHF